MKENLSQPTVIQLILQHLQLKGFKEAKKVLERESRVKAPRSHLHTSRLVTCLKQAIKDTEKVYDLAIAEKVRDSAPLEEHLFEVGLQEEEKDVQEDVDIWQETTGTAAANNSHIEKVERADSDQTEIVKV